MTARVLDLKRHNAATQAPAVEQLPSVRVGLVVAAATPAGVWVELEPNGAPVLARLGIDCDIQRLARAVEQKQTAVLAFEDGDRARPIVLGLIGSSPMQPEPEPEPEPRASAPNSFVVEVDADGRSVRLRAQEEIVLQCGEACITLKRNGKVVIRGSHVETYASGTNRIKGGSVRIN